MSEKRVRIVGAGFSGLTLAWYLRKAGWEVDLYDKGQGMIQSLETEHGLVETAANGILNCTELEELVEELGLSQDFIPCMPTSRRRYFFRIRPRRWPLSLSGSFQILKFALKYFFRREALTPKPSETIRQWSLRQLGREAGQYILETALQGIYAGDPEKMSASLILGAFLKPSQGQTLKHGRGTLSFVGGMGQLVQKLRHDLQQKGCRIHTQSIENLRPFLHEGPVVIATSAHAAMRILMRDFPFLARELEAIEVRPIVTATLFFDEIPKIKPGFGILFPRGEKIAALGVLFPAWIFPNRVKTPAVHAETWIYTPASGGPGLREPDTIWMKQIEEDRRQALSTDSKPVSSVFMRWPDGLPHYTIELEQIFGRIHSRRPRNLFLHGNYLGKIGLSKILADSKTLAQQLGEPERTKP